MARFLDGELVRRARVELELTLNALGEVTEARVVAGAGEEAFVVLLVIAEDQPKLAEVGGAGDAVGGFLRAGERWQEDGNQQRDDADDDEKLDERKTAAFGHFQPPGAGRKR